MSRVAAYLLLAALTIPLAAQSASESIEVSLTNLEVFVTDKKGNPQPTQRILEVYAGLREFLHKTVRPGDAATIVGYLRQARTRQTFTDDLTLLVKNREYVVRSRRAVVDKSDDRRMDGRVIANLFHTPDYAAIPVRLEVGEYRKVGKRWQVPIVVKVPMRSLMVQQTGEKLGGAFSVFVATGSANPAIISDVQRREQPYSFELAEAEAVRAIDFTYKATIAVDHDPDAISIGVRDDVSRDFGLARADLDRGAAGEAQ